MKVTRIVDSPANSTVMCDLCAKRRADYELATEDDGHYVMCYSCVVRYARPEIRYAVTALVCREMEKGEFDDRPKSIAEE